METKRLFIGLVEADECYIGRLEKNKAKHKRTAGRGPSSKQPVVAAKDRDTKAVVDEHAVPGAQLLHG